MKQQVTITIDADAKVRVEVNGATGKSCHDLTAALEKALGSVASVEHKPEYHRTTSVGQQQQAGH